MTTILRRILLAALVASAALSASPARAQFGTKPAPASAPVSGSAPAAATTSDFEAVVGRIGFGWNGISTLPIADVAGAQTSLNVPVLGIRYWSPSALGPFQSFGIDVGVGMTTTSGKQDQTKTPGAFGLLLHGGLPLVITQRQHIALELIPELNIGFASGSADNATGQSVDRSGFRLDVGARAGAEVFFGFMGLPQLSLEASVGLFLRMTNWSMSPPTGSSIKGNQTTFGTERFNAPWDIFTGTVAARYYF